MNEKKYYLNNVIHAVLVMMLTGSVLQTFMFEAGIGEEQVAFYISLMQIVQTAVILAFSALADRIKNIIRATALAYVLAVPVVIYMIYLCFAKDGDVNTRYILLTAFGILFNIGYGIYNVIFYKLPYHVIDMTHYDRATGISGTLGGILTSVLSLIMASLQASFDYFNVMSIVYIITLSLVPIYVATTLSMKKRNSGAVPVIEKSDKKINLFTYKPFYILIAPNLLRGFSFGIVTLSVTVGYYFGIIDAKYASILVVITNIITIVGSAVYPFLAQSLGDRKLILISSIGASVSMPLMLAGNNPISFLAAYSAAYVFVTFISASVPVAVTRIADYSVIGAYTGLRMTLHSAGVAISGAVLVGMLKLFGGIPTLLIAGIAQLISGAGYFLYMKKNGIK